ncbi:MAG: phosphatidate cytidylyltransferase [Novosphingobium sp.]|nr:phosphatidate cytidylyltransferase [Novosphingobium sp.]MCP5400817.1 phosphatidate cytidylyltransferase [Novosphingobium sp.]
MGEGEVARKSDLPVRTLSAIVMLAVAGVALYLGGLVLDALVAAVALALLFELIRLVAAMGIAPAAAVAGIVAGAAYIGLAAFSLVIMPGLLVGITLGFVILTDTGAYFAGRTFGGPKIAPAISPSKTWAGLFGGMAASALFGAAVVGFIAAAAGAMATAHDGGTPWAAIFAGAAIGAILAVAAQFGDFLESWLKRRAGVKDSSGLIPGHGGVFDRVDGLLPVAIIVGMAAKLTEIV